MVCTCGHSENLSLGQALTGLWRVDWSRDGGRWWGCSSVYELRGELECGVLVVGIWECNFEGFYAVVVESKSFRGVGWGGVEF